MHRPPSPEIVPLDQNGWNLAKQTIVRSFATDPMMRWMVRGEVDFRKTMSEVFAAFARPALNENTAFVAHGGQAVAIWLPPGVEADSERMSAALQKVVPSDLRNDVQRVFGEMGSRHSSAMPCWYLPIIGVEPSAAGGGMGTALMRHVLARSDVTAFPAYLDSSNPRNIPFYERLGFKVQARIQSGTSPTSCAMLRPAATVG